MSPRTDRAIVLALGVATTAILGLLAYGILVYVAAVAR
jgi:hypothetical protein